MNLQVKTVKVPANDSASVYPLSGRSITFLGQVGYCTATINDNTDKIPLFPGMKLTSDNPGELITKVTLFNSLNAVQNVTLYVGSLSLSATGFIQTADVPSKPYGLGEATIAAGGTAVNLGNVINSAVMTYGAGAYNNIKAVIITNLHATDRLQLLDTDGRIFDSILAGQTKSYPTTCWNIDFGTGPGFFTLKVPGANPITYDAGILFYG
jgi:hypothetical protein